MKSIVTGGAGFIGSHLVDLLYNKGHEITVIDNFSTGRTENLSSIKNKIKIIEDDIGIKGDWCSAFTNVDYVFHLAALADIVPSIENPSQYYSSNVTGTFNVLQSCINQNLKKFIYAASSSCYGIPNIYPTPEKTIANPKYPYALTKYLGEQLVMHWNDVYKIPSISLRFFNVYGTRSRTSGTYGAVFGVFLAQKIVNEPLTIVGNGTQTRDFTHVSDITNAISSSAESEITGEIFNVGSGKTISISKIANLIGGINYKKVYIPKRPGEPDCTFADINKINTLLKWSSKVTIEEGCKNVVDNIYYWKDAPVWNPKTIDDATKTWFKYLGNYLGKNE